MKSFNELEVINFEINVGNILEMKESVKHYELFVISIYKMRWVGKHTLSVDMRNQQCCSIFLSFWLGNWFVFMHIFQMKFNPSKTTLDVHYRRNLKCSTLNSLDCKQQKGNHIIQTLLSVPNENHRILRVMKLVIRTVDVVRCIISISETNFVII